MLYANGRDKVGSVRVQSEAQILATLTRENELLRQRIIKGEKLARWIRSGEYASDEKLTKLAMEFLKG